MKVDELRQYATAGGPGVAGQGGAPVGARRDVVVLLSRVRQRQRLVAVLQRAGYRVAVPQRPVDWAADRAGPVLLLTDDTPAATRVRQQAVAAAPGTTCVVLVDDPTPERYRRLLAAGATALPASSPDDDVVLGVGAAIRELACLPTTAARALAAPDGERPVLTGREVSWLRALVGGATVAGLARSAGYSQRAMYRVLNTLYARLGADNRTEALLRADRWGLLAAPAAHRVPGQRQRAGPTADGP